MATYYVNQDPSGVSHLPFRLPEAARDVVDPAEAALGGEVCLLEDYALVLHRDATLSMSHHEITMLTGATNLAAWDEMTMAYNRRLANELSHHACPPARRDGPNAARVVQRLQPSAPQAPSEVITVSFPHLRPGTILDWDVQIDEFKPNDFGPGVWGNYYLQTNIPCRRRRTTIAIAEPFAATVQLHNNAIDPVESDVGSYHVFRWELQNVPASELDAWVPPPRDFAPWMMYQRFIPGSRLRTICAETRILANGCRPR